MTTTVRRGAQGEAVRQLQRELNEEGYGVGVDGVFGANTDAAVRRYQRDHGLEADGVVGSRTWAQLETNGPTGAIHTPQVSSGGTPLVKLGDRGAAVSEVQRLLTAAGFDTKGVDGVFGQNTLAAVYRFQAAKGLGADGVVGNDTWAALRGNTPSRPTAPTVPTAPATSSELRRRMLEVARGELGKLESGTNRGEILKYPQYFGRGSEAWCADFTSWVVTHAGKSMNDPYCPSIVNTMKREGRWKGNSNPQPGDIVLFDWNHDGKSDHVGIVESVNADGSVNTIEGNASNSSGRDGVWRHTRSRSTVLGFGNP